MYEYQQTNPRVLGRRLAEARKARGKTQEEAARHLGCSRPTLIAIEKGDRPPKPEELVRLANYYGRSIHELVRPGGEVISFEPHLRAVVDPSSADHAKLNAAIAELQRFAEDYRELERLLVASPTGLNPPEVTLPKTGSLAHFAEDAATRERARLGLGSQPVLNLRQVLENDVGLRIFYGDLPSTVAGMFVFDAELGFCVFINRKHPPERRRATLAHEYGHALSDRHKPGIDYLRGAPRRSASERFAEGFGLSFLMPAIGVRRAFHEIAASTGDFRVADLCRLSNFYFVSVQAMTLRLEELGLIARGAWTMLSERGFRPRKAAADLELPSSRPETNERYPERYKYLAVQAYRKETISEGQLARFLRCDPVSAREIVADCLRRSFVDENGEVVARTMPFEDSLLNKST